MGKARDYLTGFKKRKDQRRKEAKSVQKKKARAEKLKERAEKRRYLSKAMGDSSERPGDTDKGIDCAATVNASKHGEIIQHLSIVLCTAQLSTFTNALSHSFSSITTVARYVENGSQHETTVTIEELDNNLSADDV